ncbi:MAG: beta-galactosidase [Puniceicoccaceae bacterium]
MPSPKTGPRSSRVEMINGRPMIIVNDQPVYPMIHSLTDVPSGRWSWEELPQHNIRNFGQAGIRLFQLDIALEHIWPAPDKWDMTLARKQVAGVLEVCPEASVIFRFHVRAPRWWLKAHPEEWVVYADADYKEEQAYGLLRIIEHDNNPVRRVSMASRKWRNAITEKFQQFLVEFAETPEGDALAGIQVANGVYGEWHNWGFFDNEPDVSEPMNVAFRDWLMDKYGSDEALQEAWNDPQTSFEKALAPGMSERQTDGILRDPQKERPVIDYYECMHQVVADNIVHFASTVKAHWPRPIITGTFYGYYFSTFGRQAAGGHLQLQRILKTDCIDYLSGPQAYEPEAIELGEVYRSRSLILSMRLHGKLWLDEMDVEPKIPILKDEDYEERVQQSVADVRRNTAFTYTKGMGLWYYDFNISGVDLDGYCHFLSGSQGNWDHPIVMGEIEHMQKLFQDRALAEPYSSEADVLFVFDTDSLYYSASLVGADPVTPTLIDYCTLAAFRSGIIFDPVHLDDLPLVDLDQYKVVVFGNTYALKEEERAFIQEKVACDGRQLIWFHAPGFIDETTGCADVAFTSALTGINLTELNPEHAPNIQGKIGDSEPFEYRLDDKPSKPLLAVEDSGAESMARFANSGECAIARKSFPDHTSWFVSLPGMETEPLRSLLQATGAHVYGTTDAFFYGGGSILVFHTLDGGSQTVTLRNGKSIELDLPQGPATVLLDTGSGEVLMNTCSPNLSDVHEIYP